MPAVYSQSALRQRPPAKPEPVKPPVVKRPSETRDQAIIRMWPDYTLDEIAIILGYELANSVGKRGKQLGLPAKKRAG